MKNQLKIGAILTYLSLFLGNVISLFYTPFMLRALGQSEFGLFTLANAVVGYLTVLDFGFGSATIRYTAKYKAEKEDEKIKSMYGMFIVLYSLIGVITLVLGSGLSFFADKLFTKGLSSEEIHTVKILLIIATINLAVSFPFGVFTSIITAYERFIFLKISSLLRLILNPLVYIPVLMFGYKSIGLIIASSVLNLVFLLINLIFCISKLKIKISLKSFDFSLLKEIITYSVWIFVGSIVSQLWWNAGQFILGIFASSAAIAIYGISMQFKTYFESFATAISGVFLPRMTKMVAEDAPDEDFSNYFIKVGRLQFIIIALITSGFILFGKQFISIWAGSDYQQAYYVTLMIFIPLSLVDTQTLGITILQAKNKHKFRSIIYLIIVIFCIIISIPFVKKLSIYGCAGATALALIIGNLLIMNWYYDKKIKLNIKKFWFEIFKMMPGIIVCTFFAFIILKFLPPLIHYKTLALGIILYVFVYCIVIYFLSMNKYEKELVSRGVKKLLKR